MTIRAWGLISPRNDFDKIIVSGNEKSIFSYVILAVCSGWPVG